MTHNSVASPPSDKPAPSSDDTPCPPPTDTFGLAAIGHEWRTGLSTILGMAELLQNADDLQKARRQAAVIHESALAMRVILDDMLEYSHLAHGTARPKPEPFFPADFLAELYDACSIQARAAGCDFLTTLPSNLPERLVGDGLHASQAIERLLALTLKLSQRGEIHADFLFAPLKANASLLRGTLHTSGCLLNENQCKALFKPMRPHSGELPKIPVPSGFGPAIAKGWIRLLGGSLRVRCTHGHMAKLIIEIPFAQFTTFAK
ncbi:MAG: HAMP domain-containing histidine kinase [Magnetococcales bacterium]|nr:HAMP domain-containing histidine kinase [Magnetococcales bacterium]